MKIVVGLVAAVYLLVLTDAGSGIQASNAMTALRSNFEDHHFQAFQRSLLRAAMTVGKMQQYENLIKDIDEVEIFQINLRGPVNCDVLNSEMVVLLEQEKFEKLINTRGPMGDISVYALSDSSAINQLVVLTKDSINYRLIEMHGQLDIKALSGFGPTGLTNLFNNLDF